jgi:glyceraldehyde 3-phosphate dehydrogenase
VRIKKKGDISCSKAMCVCVLTLLKWNVIDRDLKNESVALCSSLFQRQPHLLLKCQPHPVDKMVKIGVNKFGCNGCLITRAAIYSPLGKMEIVAINDPSLTSTTWSTSSTMTLPMASSTAQSRKNGKLVINGKPITIFQERDSANIKWGDAGAEYVLESTNKTTMEKAGAHLKGGAKRVIISAPSADAPMFVMGVNHKKYDKSLKIVSNTSCATNCLAPLALWKGS